jgi:hypothetical protein
LDSAPAGYAHDDLQIVGRWWDHVLFAITADELAAPR